MSDSDIQTLDLARARERMVQVQIAQRGIRDSRLLDAMRCVPREAFVEPGFEEFAYGDRPCRSVRARLSRSHTSWR